MPFQSKAQRAKFASLVQEGKMSQATFNEWEAATPKNKPLPERVVPKRATTPSIKTVKVIKAAR